MKSGKVLLGVLAGVASGALLGILFAPEKGSKTRKKILSKGQDYADELKEKFDVLVDNVSEKYRRDSSRHEIDLDYITDQFEPVKQKPEEIVTKAKAKYNALKSEVNNAGNNS